MSNSRKRRTHQVGRDMRRVNMCLPRHDKHRNVYTCSWVWWSSNIRCKRDCINSWKSKALGCNEVSDHKWNGECGKSTLCRDWEFRFWGRWWRIRWLWNSRFSNRGMILWKACDLRLTARRGWEYSTNYIDQGRLRDKVFQKHVLEHSRNLTSASFYCRSDVNLFWGDKGVLRFVFLWSL